MDDILDNEYKLKGINQWVKPIAVYSRLDTRQVWVTAWGATTAGWWSHLAEYKLDTINLRRKRVKRNAKT